MKTTTQLLGVAIACVVGLAGCGKTEDKVASTERDISSSISDKSAKVGQAMDDTAITTKVKTELLAQKDVNGTAISVDTKNGQVTLSGTVPPAQISRAEELARKVDGVREVVNQLKADTAAAS